MPGKNFSRHLPQSPSSPAAGPAGGLLGEEAMNLKKDPAHQHRRQRPHGLGQQGCVPDPQKGAGVAVPGCITQQAGVTPAGTVPACSTCLPACQPQSTLISGKMSCGRVSRAPPPTSGPKSVTGDLDSSAGCLSTAPWVSRDKESSGSPSCSICLEYPQGSLFCFVLFYFVLEPSSKSRKTSWTN